MDTSAPIGFLAGWKHCMGTSSYWIWIGAFLLIVAIIYFLIKRWSNKTNTDPSKMLMVFWAVVVLLGSLFLFMRPAQVGWNTSVDMAAHGQYLGY